MGKPSKAIEDFMKKYSVARDEIWEVHGTTWVVKHKALERIAAEQGITWDRPAVLVSDLAGKIALVCAFGKLGDRAEWSLGEAAPYNNKNGYPAAMAEKRARDRVILKLLITHGDIYSEAEADEFKEPAKRENPHVTRPNDIFEEIDHTDIPANGNAQRMKVKDARPEYDALLKEMRRIDGVDDLKEWGQARAATINALPGDWPAMFRGEYALHKQNILASNNVLMAG